MDDFESPEVQKDFPGLYTPGVGKGKKEDPECKCQRDNMPSIYRLIYNSTPPTQFSPIQRKRTRRRTKRTRIKATPH